MRTSASPVYPRISQTAAVHADLALVRRCHGGALDDFVEDIIASEIEGAFISTLTACQKSIYIHCMKPNISVREYSRLSGLAVTTIQNHIEAVRKKYKKYFM